METKFIIDTNVPILSGTLATDIPVDQAMCARECLRFIKEYISNPESKIVLDSSWRVLKEYQKHMGDFNDRDGMYAQFYRWVCIQVAKGLAPEDNVQLHEIDENCFAEYPTHKGLANFDPPDRKFIALANAHVEHPPIVEGSDSKWWGIYDALKECGICVKFLCEDYIKNKFEQKIGP